MYPPPTTEEKQALVQTMRREGWHRIYDLRNGHKCGGLCTVFRHDHKPGLLYVCFGCHIAWVNRPPFVLRSKRRKLVVG